MGCFLFLSQNSSQSISANQSYSKLIYPENVTPGGINACKISGLEGAGKSYQAACQVAWDNQRDKLFLLDRKEINGSFILLIE